MKKILFIALIISQTAFAQNGYDHIDKFKNGKAIVIKNGLFGIINEAGIEFVPAKYNHIGKFKKGKAIVSHDGILGIIDEQGNELVSVSK